jgi:DNA helicase-2/ATP-dependent DNA helicase PcrA
MTVHSAKGLEFKYVFVVGLEEKLFPSNFNGFLSVDDLEEERRLFYVALTRAMKKAWLSYARQRYNWGKLNYCEPSRFINEIDEKFLSLPTENNRPSFFGRAASSWFDDREEHIVQRPPAPPTRKLPENPSPQLSSRLTSMKQAMTRPSFKADDPGQIKPGMMVEHQRFGLGKVIEMEGDNQSLKATVLFQNAGRKQLLLKFAGLKIVG